MKNPVRPFRLIRASTTPSNARLTNLIVILLALVSPVTPTSSRAGESRMGALHGIVIADGPNGQSYSAPGAKVRLSGTSQDSSMSAIADDSGEYKFRSVPAGRYTLEVTLDGFDDATRPITIRAGETTVENVKLEVKSVRAEVTARSERVGLRMSDAKPASELEQETLQTLSLMKVNASRASQSRVAVSSTALPNPLAPADGKFTPSFGGSHFTKAGITYNTFNENFSRYFVSPRNQTVHLPRFFSVEMPALKSLRLRVSPKVSLRNHFYLYPRDFQGNPGSANFGEFPTGAGRVLGMRFVIEKKSRVAEPF